MKPRITYANVVATLALFVALGGTATAVSKKYVTNADIDMNAVSEANRLGHAHLVRHGGPKKVVMPSAVTHRSKNVFVTRVYMSPPTYGSGNEPITRHITGHCHDDEFLDSADIFYSQGTSEHVLQQFPQSDSAVASATVATKDDWIQLQLTCKGYPRAGEVPDSR